MKKLLIIVDYQNDFVDGALGFEGAETLEEKILERVLTFEKNKDDIVFTLDTHQKDYLETMEGKKLPIPHCLEGSKGHEVYGRLKKYADKYPAFKKETFGSKELARYLESHKYDYVELVGLVSNICVFTNAVIAKTILPNAEIVVLKDCTGSNDLDIQEKSFAVLENLHIEVR